MREPLERIAAPPFAEHPVIHLLGPGDFPKWKARTEWQVGVSEPSLGYGASKGAPRQRPADCHILFFSSGPSFVAGTATGPSASGYWVRAREHLVAVAADIDAGAVYERLHILVEEIWRNSIVEVS